MKPRWEDLNARSRGLATHLLTRQEVAGLARVPDIPALAVALGARGYVIPEEGHASPLGLELAARRQAGLRLRTLARWSGSRTDVLAVLFEDEDRRSLRALLRGTVQRVPPESRLSGLLPTPVLPERALQELARQPAPGALATLLAAWNSPYGPPLLPEATRPEPDLLRLEVALNRTFFARALGAARQAGKRGVLTGHVRQLIDLENAYAALVLAEGREERIPDVFVPGGERLTRDAFEAIARSGSSASAAQRLDSAFAGTPLAAVMGLAVTRSGDLERLVLGVQIAELHRRALNDPLGPAPLLHYALRLRAELLDLRHLIWGVSLGAPPAVLTEGLAA